VRAAFSCVIARGRAWVGEDFRTVREILDRRCQHAAVSR